MKLQHWCGSQTENGWRGPQMLEFAVQLRRETPRDVRRAGAGSLSG